MMLIAARDRDDCTTDIHDRPIVHSRLLAAPHLTKRIPHKAARRHEATKVSVATKQLVGPGDDRPIRENLDVFGVKPNQITFPFARKRCPLVSSKEDADGSVFIAVVDDFDASAGLITYFHNQAEDRGDSPGLRTERDTEYALFFETVGFVDELGICLLYTSPSPRDGLLSRMPSSA